jgi:hypothetical protein
MWFSSGTGWSKIRFFTDDASDCGSDGSLAISNWCDCVDIDATDNRPRNDCRSYTYTGRDSGTNSDAYTCSDAGVKSNAGADADTKADSKRDAVFAGARSFRDTD